MLKRARLFIGFCLFIGIFGGGVAHAQTTINASSCSSAAVNTAWGMMSSGSYIIAIPSGTCNWTTALSLTVPSAVTSVVVQGNSTVTCTGTAGTSSYACTPVDNTIIEDDYGSSLLNVNLRGGAFRLTGTTWKGNSAITSTSSNGFLTFGGSSTSFRVDHNDFITTTYGNADIGGGMTLYSPIYGVVDHNQFQLSGQDNGVRDYSGSGDYGDTAFSQPTLWGSANNLYIESNVFTYGYSNDCDLGGTEVLRYNTIIADPSVNDTGGWQMHGMGQAGTEPNDPSRGCRMLEVYHNYIYNPNPTGNDEYGVGGAVNSTGMAWGNTITSGYDHDFVFEIEREAEIHPQYAPPNGWGYCGNGSSGSTSAWDGNNSAVTGWPCISQPGRGQGDLLNGQAFPNRLNSTTGTVAYSHQKLEPWYSWNESIVSGSIYNAPSWNGVAPTVNLDFFVQVSTSANTSPTSPFNATTGTGFGTAANRPTTCTAGPGGTYGTSPTGSYGVAYFATDANGGNGELYVCTGTNTWTAIYEPYAYPHPLDGGTQLSSSNNAPQPPTGLSATVQ